MASYWERDMLKENDFFPNQEEYIPVVLSQSATESESISLF